MLAGWTRLGLAKKEMVLTGDADLAGHGMCGENVFVRKTHGSTVLRRMGWFGHSGINPNYASHSA